jgi:histone acetyltransferase (RNA polymerase elongator complex component)
VFCDQERITGRTAAPDPSSVPATIRAYLASQRRGRDSQPEPVEVAFFGGNFTALDITIQQAYLEQVRPFIDSGDIRSVRISTRPDALSPQRLSFLTHYLVATVELGTQSMDDEVLQRSGRGHTAEHTRQAVRLLSEQGFSVGMQLMPGLPGDSRESFCRTVRQVIDLHPDFIRIYPTLVISGTPLEALYRSGRYLPLSLEDAVSLCRDAVADFMNAGITVIRLGLQPTEALERPGIVVAGPWHPAFGQRVRSAVMLERMRTAIRSRPDAPPALVVTVHPADLSTATGQRRVNVTALKMEFGLDALSLRPDPSVPRDTVRLA